ncbi:hypothetical protein ACIBHX_00900 [Nonomuraea sp. NPDC050536]|uniref:hypothetical protein n=1 Tax=Nonomuraea sp. NPDC050536 TaxID=3364366 RepID=UPI0037CC6742
MTFSNPPSAVRRTAWAGIAALVPYAAIKTYWACGGRAGLPPGFDLADEFRRNGAPVAVIWLEHHGVDFTAALAVAGAVLLLALTRPWGMRLPRWIPLGVAWPGTLLLPYGVLTAVLALSGGGGGGHGPTNWLVVAAVLAFCGIGGALAVCARSYQARSRRVRT